MLVEWRCIEKDPYYEVYEYKMCLKMCGNLLGFMNFFQKRMGIRRLDLCYFNVHKKFYLALQLKK